MNASHEIERRPHAVLEVTSRRPKGVKIERLLSLAKRQQPLRVLEIGTGSGGIANYFGTHSELRCEVVAVDVHDNRVVTEGYQFIRVSGVELPFEDASFDLVITNHVIEHVGDSEAQRFHLQEIHRVMKVGGQGYLAVPNRWMLTEPHYGLAFLSWLPPTWRTPYLRIRGRGTYYDCEPLQLGQLERMFAVAGFDFHNLCIEALRVTLELEASGSIINHFFRLTPDGILRLFLRVIPTLIYKLERF